MATASQERPGAATAAPRIDPGTVERRTLEIGRELFARVGGASGPWRRSWWENRFMDWTLDDPEVRAQLFRFIDVLPALHSPESTRRHLAEYLDEADDRAPWWLRTAVAWSPPGTDRERWLAASARWAAETMAHKFIAGATPDEALQTVLKLRARRLAFTADLLGEAVISEAEADVYQQTCLALIQGLAEPVAAQPEDPLIDRDQHGPIPRVNLSLKLTSLTPHFDPIHPERSIEEVAARLRPILRTARDLGAYVHVDMEQYTYRALTFELFKRVLAEADFRDWSDVGIVVQTYQPDAEDELRDLLQWVETRGAPITVRLVKGAYWDSEVLTARGLGWPEPVYLQKWRSDAAYERCARFLMEHHDKLRPAIASHNIRSLAHAIAAAEAIDLPKGAFELQTLHGMGDAIQDALVGLGFRTRVYTPYGAMLPGMAYLVRRLLENTSNNSFLKVSAAAGAPIDELLRNPEETGAMLTRSRPKAPAPSPDSSSTSSDLPPLPPFRNEPISDFAKAENRQAMAEALRKVEAQLGQTHSLLINGEYVETPGHWIDSHDPSHSSRLLGRVAAAKAEHADAALTAALAAADSWGSVPADERAAILVRAAAILRDRRFELAAWEVFECAKPWREADADVCEAIDFCEFYAREMIRLATPRVRDVPGETNRCEPLPRGVAVVIPPWNFPLAIPCGMTVAPLAAGNTVVLKPAEQSPIIARKLVEILHEAGVPPGALHYLPGWGEEAGQALVNDPRVNVVSFTGSRDVGLLINRQAAETPPGQDHIKKVIAELGGKNAIIVDDDADLDEAVVGVLASAFGYAGQKCSACSRVIVLEGIYDAFLARLVESAKALKIGPAADPETFVGPVISAEARKRILEYKELAPTEGRVLLDVDVSAIADRGFYVGPMIVADVKPTARIAREEIFGPLLSVIKAEDLTEALAIANGVSYALTGGLYSRSPRNITRVRREFLVGNLYINRTITGALVDRQPFGGFKLSGVGAKAGGSDYLHEFLLVRSITENTMRRGFAPEEMEGV